MKQIFCSCLIAALILSGCTDQDNNTHSDSIGPDTVIAQYRGGEISLTDLDQFLLNQPSSRRWRTGEQSTEWLTTVLKRIATDRLLLDEAQLVGADQDPVFQARDRRVQRNAYSDVYLKQQQFAQSLQATEEQVRAYFEANLDRYQFPEQRFVFNIFKAVNESRTLDQAKQEMELLRSRQQAGENFQVLAEQHSESESRHRGGSIGTFRRGVLSEDFDRIIFSMPSHSISEVIQTADGVHLFFVGNVLEAQNNEFEDVAAVVFQDMMTDRMLEHLKLLSEELTAPEPYNLPDKRLLQRLLRTAPDNIDILRVGDFSMSKAEFRDYVAEIRRQLGSRKIDDLALRLLQEIAYREVIYQHVSTEDVPANVKEQLNLERQTQLIDHYLESKLAAWLSQSPEKLRTHYENNQNRFTSPLSVNLTRLIVPLSDNPSQRMARLENARVQLDQGEVTLQNLSDEMNGEIRDTGMLNATHLATLDPQAARFAFVLDVGTHSPPYRVPEGLSLFKVTDRREPAIQPLAMVRPQVVNDYLENYSVSIYEELSDALLDEHEFELARQYLDGAFKAIALPGLLSTGSTGN